MKRDTFVMLVAIEFLIAVVGFVVALARMN